MRHDRRDQSAHFRPFLYHQVHRPRFGTRGGYGHHSCASGHDFGGHRPGHRDDVPGRVCPRLRARRHRRRRLLTPNLRGQGLILIADDEELVRTMARVTLERFGYTVVLATNGREAEDRFAERREEYRGGPAGPDHAGFARRGGATVYPRAAERRTGGALERLHGVGGAEALLRISGSRGSCKSRIQPRRSRAKSSTRYGALPLATPHCVRNNDEIRASQLRN